MDKTESFYFSWCLGALVSKSLFATKTQRHGSFLLHCGSIFILALLISSCQTESSLIRTQRKITRTFAKESGTFAMAFKDLSTGKELLINDRMQFHAASTMKTPVMIEVFKQAASGKISLTDSILVTNQFASIVDGSAYRLFVTSDSEKELYSSLGKRLPLQTLVFNMITVSSNLATNIVIALVGAKNVTQTMRDLGADSIQVLRGVEDSLAYARGWNNTTTARDLMIIFERIASGAVVDSSSCQAMIEILKQQRFNEIIPALLPANVRVAHKTGSLTGVHHDSGIVFLPDGRKYVLVILSKGLHDEKSAIKTMAAASRRLYDYMLKIRPVH